MSSTCCYQCSWSHWWSDSWEGQKALPCNACKAKNFTQNVLTRKDLIPCKMHVFTDWHCQCAMWGSTLFAVQDAAFKDWFNGLASFSVWILHPFLMNDCIFKLHGRKQMQFGNSNWGTLLTRSKPKVQVLKKLKIIFPFDDKLAFKRWWNFPGFLHVSWTQPYLDM